MVDPKNHSFTSNSKIIKVFGSLILFIAPVLIIMTAVEIYIRTIPTTTKLKKDYISANSDSLQVLILGSSQMERAINPEFLDAKAINLSNSAQTLDENYILLKHFEKSLPALKVVVIEVLFNTLQIKDNYSPLVIHHLNWIDYKANTFGRRIKFQDNLLYYTHPQYFTNLIINHINESSPQNFNIYGFDTNKFDGSFNVANFDINKVEEKDIYIENSLNNDSFEKNSKLLIDFLSLCESKKLDVVIYGTPSHEKYNSLRNKEMINMRNSLFEDVKLKFPKTKFLLNEENKDYDYKLFFNANHLNSKGAEKASKELNKFLTSEFNF